MIVELENDQKDLFESRRLELGFSILQSWNWGELKSNQWTIHRILINKDIPVQIFVRKIPMIGKSFGYIPRGFSNETISKNPELLKIISDYAKSNLKVSHLIIDPNIDNLNLVSKFRELDFREVGHTVQPQRTSIIDLTKGMDQIFADLKSQFRRDYKKTVEYSKDFRVYSDNPEGVGKLYSVIQSIISRTDFKENGKKYYEDMWSAMSINNQIRIYTIEKETSVLGSLLVIFDENRGAYELYGGVSNEGKNLRLSPILRILVIQDLINHGCKSYDQWGVGNLLPNGEYDTQHPLWGISIFKQSMGGKHVEFLPGQVIVFDQIAFQIFKFADKFKDILLKLRKFLHL